MNSFRVLSDGVSTRFIIKPSLRSRLPLQMFLLVWMTFWTVACYETLVFQPPQGGFFVIDVFAKLFFVAMWLVGMTALLYVTFYKEELVFRLNMIERKFCAIIRIFAKQVSRSPNTKLVRSEKNANGAVSLSIRTGKESLNFFYGIAPQADKLVDLIRKEIPDLQFENRSTSTRIGQ